MLNKTGITKEEAFVRNQILANAQDFYAVGRVIDGSVAGVSEGGRTIVRAGTPLKIDLEDSANKAVEPTTTNGVSDANAILLNDIDNTGAIDVNGSVLIFGFVNLGKIEASALGKLTAEVKAALTMIKFLKF